MDGIDPGLLSSGLMAMERAGDSVFSSLMPSVTELFNMVKLTAWAVVIGVLLLQQRFLHPAMAKALVLFVVIGWLIQVFPTAADKIVTAMGNVGAIAVPDMQFDLSDPGYIAYFGFKAIKPLMVSTRAYLGPVAIFGHFFEVVFYGFAMVTILLAFATLALHAFFARVEYLILRTAAWFVIPFATLGKTSFIATKAIGYIGSVGLRVLALGVLAAISAVTLMKYEEYRVDDITAAFGLSILACALLIANIKAPAAAAALINSGPVLDGAMAWQAMRAGMSGGLQSMATGIKNGAAAGKAAYGSGGGVSGMVVGIAKHAWNSGTSGFGGGQQGNQSNQSNQSSNGSQGNYGPGSYQGGWGQGQQGQTSSNQQRAASGNP